MAKLNLIKASNEENRRQLAIQQQELKKVIQSEQWEINHIKDIKTNYKTNTKVSFGRCNKIKS